MFGLTTTKKLRAALERAEAAERALANAVRTELEASGFAACIDGPSAGVVVRVSKPGIGQFEAAVPPSPDELRRIPGMVPAFSSWKHGTYRIRTDVRAYFWEGPEVRRRCPYCRRES